MKHQLKIVGASDKRSRAFSKVEDALAAIRKGEMVIVVDDEDRENKGDLTIAAEKVTPDVINFIGSIWSWLDLSRDDAGTAR